MRILFTPHLIGKTTAARIFGKLLHEVGAREKDVFIETTASSLKREGSKKFVDLVQQAMGGVLFVDEAYQLDPSKDPVGRDIVEEILRASEENREDLTIILAGYKDDIEQKLFSYNTGLASRFDAVPFNDFHDGQLREIWDNFLTKHKWQVEEDNVSNVAVRRVARSRHRKGFGNARSIRQFFHEATKHAMTRYVDAKEASETVEKQVICMHDVIGRAPNRNTIPELDLALRELEQMDGLSEVKASIYQIVDLAAANYHRELKGIKILELVLNRLFLGNPGTGKTTVAKLYSRVLKSLNLLSNGEIEYKTASDFVGSAIGESETKTGRILDLCKGKVLVIDEAYNLHGHMYGKNVLDTIVEKVSGNSDDDIAILMCGYEKEMKEMMRKENPGLARRFNSDNPLLFEDYSDTTLANIVLKSCKTDGLIIKYNALVVIIQQLAQQRRLPNFGNAGAVRNMLSSIKSRMVSRVGKTDIDDMEIILNDIVGDDRDEHGRASGDPLEELKALYGMEELIENINAFRVLVEQNARDGITTVKSNWQLLGNPGTGKTTVARKMHALFQNMGLCAPHSPMGETRAAELMGNVVGEAEKLVKEAFDSANGGVLFIDEAYELGDGPYGKKALSTLVGLTGNEQNVIVILAGYEDDMRLMLAKNSGGEGRFMNKLRFPDWSPSECTGFVLNMIREASFIADEGVKECLQVGFEELKSRPGWANARDALSLWRDRILKARASRIAEMSEVTRNVTVDDVEKGVKSYLADRPVEVLNTDPRDQWSAYSHLRMNESQSFPALRNTRQRVREIQDAEESASQDNFTEDQIRNLRAQEEAEREREEAELQRLRDEEERLRKEREEQEERERLAREQQQREAELEAARQRAEAERRLKEAQEAAQRIRDAQRVQERIRQIGLCPQSFRWIDMGHCYRCAGGSHTLSKNDPRLYN